MIALGGTNITKAYLGQTELANVAIGDELLLSSEPLPLPYDAEVEYLESSGTQYIDTGISPNTNTVLEAKYMTVVGATPFAARWTGASTYDTFGVVVGSNGKTTIMFGRYSKKKFIQETIPLSSEIIITIDIGQIAINGTTYTIERSSFNSTYSIYLFCMNNVGSVLGNDSTRIYSFKLTESGNTLLDLIPVRVGQVGYMYDKVSKTLFGNAGTSDFILGNDVI